MKYLILVLLLQCIPVKNHGQDIYICSESGDLWRIDPEDCSLGFIIHIQRVFHDISFHPDGRLFGVIGGRIYLINRVNGTVTLIDETVEDYFTALTIGSDGIMYMMGSSLLWTYDLTTNTFQNLGDTGFRSAGDLTFYKGELYLATDDAEIARIDVEMPSASNVVIQAKEHLRILGIVSHIVGCEVKCYASYVPEHGGSEIYEIDFENQSLEYICDTHVTVYGGASTTEFLASNPVSTGILVGTDPDCSGTNGQIAIPDADGFGLLQYSLHGGPFQADSIFKNLSPGEYEIHVMDSKGCLDSSTITLLWGIGPVIDFIAFQPAICNEMNGSLEIFASGGTPPYEYSIDNINFQSSNLFTNLAPGFYLVIVRDASGCVTIDNIPISEHSPASITSVNMVQPTCNHANGSLHIVTSMTNNVMYRMNQGDFQDNPIFPNLGSGVYFITTTDLNGCSDTMTVTLQSQNLPEVSAVEIKPETCSQMNGAIEVTALGGTGAVQYSMDGGNFQNESIFSSLSAGTYTIHVTDGYGCSSSVIAEVGEVPGPIIKSIHITPSDCNTATGQLALSITEGNPPFEILLNRVSHHSDTLFTALSSGEYEIKIADQAGCMLDTTIVISNKGCEIYIPNTFSPNGDGINDLFHPQSITNSSIVIKSFEIFDRWGNQLFQKQNILFDPLDGSWNGNYKYQEVPTGVYVYKIITQTGSEDTVLMTGTVTLVR